MANTKIRSFRIPDEVYLPAQAFAQILGVSVTELVVNYLASIGSDKNVTAFLKSYNAEADDGRD